MFMKKIAAFIVVAGLLVGGTAMAYDGDMVADKPSPRLGEGGGLTIHGFDSGTCFSGKVTVDQSPEMINRALSMALAAQLSGKKLRVWYTKYDTSKNPMRCRADYLQIVD